MQALQLLEECQIIFLRQTRCRFDETLNFVKEKMMLTAADCERTLIEPTDKTDGFLLMETQRYISCINITKYCQDYQPLEAQISFPRHFQISIQSFIHPVGYDTLRRV